MPVDDERFTSQSAEQKAEQKAARRVKMKALMSSSLLISKERADGMFYCGKCGVACGSEAALQNHVSSHGSLSSGQAEICCQFCGKATDIKTQRAKFLKQVAIEHGTEGQLGKPGAIVLAYKRIAIEVGHVCNERIKRRPVDDLGYRSSKK